MQALEKRIAALEQAIPQGEKVKTIIISSLRRNGSPEREIIAVRDMKGRRWEKLPGENHSTFISRARGDGDGIRMLFEDEVRWADDPERSARVREDDARNTRETQEPPPLEIARRFVFRV